MQINYGDFPMLIPKISKKRKVRWGIIAIVVLLAAASIVGAFFYFRARSFNISGKTYYCYCPYEKVAKEEVQDFCKRVKNAGGAGIVLNEGGLYIVAALYQSDEQASSVAEKNGSGSVVAITVPDYRAKSESEKQRVYQSYAEFSYYANSFAGYAIALDESRESEYVCEAFLQSFERRIEEDEDGIFARIPTIEKSAELSVGARLRAYAVMVALEWKNYAQNGENKS